MSDSLPQSRHMWLKPAIITLASVVIFAAMVMSTTVRTTAEADAADPTKFNATEFAATAFEKDIAPYIEKNAVDIVQLSSSITNDKEKAGAEFGKREGPSTAWSFPVTLTGMAGTVKGTLLPITIEGIPQNITVYIQIGPAITGTALRDVTGNITFQQFVNQLAYQEASTEINNRVKERVLADVDAPSLAGKTVTVTGAFALGNPAVYQVTPTTFEVEQ